METVLGGRYTLERLIARGGIAAVYRARDGRSGAPVAIKVIPASAFPTPETRSDLAAFAAERRRIHHPSVVRILDHGDMPDGGAYLAMELVEGEDLRHRLARDGRLGPSEAIEILQAVCAGAYAAHRAGIVHGDLKPENVLLPREGPAAMIGDFIAGRNQAEGMILGTPAYMAPEQLRGERATARSDIFSIAVMAFELLTGEAPFGHGSAGEVRLRQQRGVPELGAGDVSACLATAVRSALSLDPDRRPPTALALSALLASSRATP